MVESYSWKTSEDSAIKTIDKSVINHKGSGVPKDMWDFFSISDLDIGAKMDVEVIFDRKNYNVYIEKRRNETHNLIRARLFWHTDLANELLREISEKDIGRRCLVFKRLKSNRYEVSINNIDLSEAVEFSELDEITNEEYIEGESKEVLRQYKKRNRYARERKIEQFSKIHGKIYCEVCGENDIATIEVHHENVFVSNMSEYHLTKLDDLRVVCSNCHKKLHYYNLRVDDLKGNN